MHDARAAANSLIRESSERDLSVTPLKVQKLLYFCHAWMLGIHHRPLIKQNFKAWEFGPIVPVLFHALKHYGARPVQSEISAFGIPDYDDDQTDIVNQVLDKYGELSAARLMLLSHLPGTPWHQTYHGRWARFKSTIPNSLIEEYHERIANRRR